MARNVFPVVCFLFLLECERDRAVFVRGDFSPKTGLMGEKLGTENGDVSEADY